MLSFLSVGKLVDAASLSAFNYKTYERDFISYDSSIESDFKNMQLDFKLVDANHIVTITNGYANIDGEIKDYKFVYYYFKDLKKQLPFIKS